MATLKKVKSYKKMGTYKETTADKRKKAVDFLLVGVSPYIIKWKKGKTEVVTKRALTKLQKKHTWSTDF